MPALKHTCIALFLLLPGLAVAQLYSKAYGDSTKPAVIFLHGGPGYNAAGFELSTAQALADRGYFVIVFDQRGCARSPDPKAQYTLAEAFGDVRSIYQRYHLTKATLMGHSWGGTLGILFAEKDSGQVARLVLVGSPVSYQQTFRTILTTCRALYTEQKSPQLAYIDMLEKMDTASLDYSSYCFAHAMNAGLYRPKQLTDDAKAIYARMRQSPDAALLSQSTYPPVLGLYLREHYTTLDLTSHIRALTIPVMGLYGAEDGLFDAAHLGRLRNLMGDNRFRIIDGASHNVFIDRQNAFLDAFQTMVKKF